MPYHLDRAAQRAAREHRIGELLEAGHSHAEAAAVLGISPPAVTQIVHKSATLRRFVRTHSRKQELSALRRELAAIAGELQSIQRQARKAIRELDDDLSSLAVDDVLGLR